MPITPRSPPPVRRSNSPSRRRRQWPGRASCAPGWRENPDDHEARFELATALFGSGDREAAIDELLDLFKRDREWNEQAARKQLVKFFEAMGPTDPLTLSGRRRLSAHDVFLREMRDERAAWRNRAARRSFRSFRLTGVLLLPRGRLPLNIFEPRYLAMTRDALAGDRLIGMVQPSDPRGVASNPAGLSDRLRRAHHVLRRDR